MPASCRAAPAGCILGLSFFEPMMIPTWGSSTSISSNASSTAGIAVAPVGCGSSEISLISSSLGSRVISSTGYPLDRAGGDVGADLHSVEGDPAGRIVCAIARRGGRRPQCREVEHAAARGDDLAAALGRAGLGHLD